MTSNSIDPFVLPPGPGSQRHRRGGVLTAAVLAALVAAVSPAAAAEATARDTPEATEASARDKAETADDRQAFCTNIRSAAMDAHARWQAAEIRQMEEALRRRAAELEARQKDIEAWLTKREAIARKAEENVVSIYGRMRAEAAAVQIAAMTDDMAISILSKLNPRTSSAILNEMEPARAAHLTSSVAGPVPPKSSLN
jgi:flagellar motility protein MotE (MotC chaperone)